MITNTHLYEYAWESNQIEGIQGVKDSDVTALKRLVTAKTVDVEVLKHYVAGIQPNAVLRDKFGLDVRVGSHVPMAGGPGVVEILKKLLEFANEQPASMFLTYRWYEHIHPFTDGNGRSGRALWLWQYLRTKAVVGDDPVSFLRTYHYQSLASFDAEVKSTENRVAQLLRGT